MAFVLIVYRLFPLGSFMLAHDGWLGRRDSHRPLHRASASRAFCEPLSWKEVEIDKLWCWASFVQFAFNCLICLKNIIERRRKKEKRGEKGHLSTWNEMHINIMRMHAMASLMQSTAVARLSDPRTTRLSSLGLLSSINFHSRSPGEQRTRLCLGRDALIRCGHAPRDYAKEFEYHRKLQLELKIYDRNCGAIRANDDRIVYDDCNQRESGEIAPFLSLLTGEPFRA